MNVDPRALGTLLAVASLLPAQTVWNVTTTNGIQPAINAASPGDVIVLTAGGGFPDYEPFTLNKGLTIRGNGAKVGYSPGFTLGSVTINVPPGQVAHLEGLDCTYGYSPFGSLGCPVIVNGGSVRLEDCTIRRGNGNAVTVANADVVLVRCIVTAVGSISAGAGIAASNASVTLRDCVVLGADATCHPITCTTSPSNAGPAVRLESTRLHAERILAIGGLHAAPSFAGDGAAALVATDSAVWLADSFLFGGNSNSGLGGTALVNAGPSQVEMRLTQLTGGAPGGGTSAGLVDPNAPLLRLGLAPGWTRGATSTLSLAGDPNALFGLWLATDAQAAQLPGIVVEPVWLLTGAPLVFGLLDAAGTASFAIPVPNVASLQHATVWCQALSGVPFPLRASTIAGGVVR